MLTKPEIKPLDDDEVEKIAKAAVEAAVDFMESDLRGDRQTADLYYQGATSIPTTPGRSKVVVSKVRDAVKGVVPSLARIFTQSDTIVEFYSDDEEDEKLCSDATLFCNGVFHRFGGYKATIEASTDALKAKVGIVKVTLQKKQLVTHMRYTPEDAASLNLPVSEKADDEAIISDTRSITIWDLSPIPPEEFIITSEANDIASAFACGHRRNIRVSDAVEMGYPFSELKELTADVDVEEDNTRRGFNREDRESGQLPATDPSSKPILWTDLYIRVDVDGDGIAELRHVVLGGEGYKLMSNEPVNFAPFACFKAELQPHVFYPICLAEDMQQDQDAQTALLRSIIDNAALVNSPRTEVNETAVNLDDVKNGEIGAIIRVTEMGQINELATPFVAGQTLPVLEYLDGVAEQRSGVTKLSQGLDPNALAGGSRIAANAAVTGGDARIEMMARNIAETGLKEMFMLMLRTAIQDLHGVQSIRTPEGFQKVNPSLWHDQLSVRTNVGTGAGRPEEKKQVLGALLPIQQQFVQTLGLQNPICGWPQLRETIKQMLRLSGIHDVNTYFPFVPEDQLAQMDQQAQQSSAQQAEQAKAQAQAQSQAAMAQAKAMVDMVKVEQEKNTFKHMQEMQKIQQDYEAQIGDLKAQMAELIATNRKDLTKIYLDDDRQRDKNDMDFAIDVAKLNKDMQQFEATQERVDEEREAEGVQYGSEIVDDATEVEEPGEPPEATEPGPPETGAD